MSTAGRRRLSTFSVRALALLGVLAAWAPPKLLWEADLAREQDRLRYRGTGITRQLRDRLSQGLTIGILAGLRSGVADFLWLNVTEAWKNEEWFRMESAINLCTALQPRSELFWDQGGWQLAYNASSSVLRQVERPELQRLHDSRFWIEKGLAVYLRGIESNPEKWKLWASTGMLYQQRLKDYRQAAFYYARANELPGVPIFYERFPAIMLDRGYANDPAAAYAEWRKLWLRLTPAQREEKQHWKEKIEASLRRLEAELSIPEAKRIFPK